MDKTLILHDGEYKKWNQGSPAVASNINSIPKMTSNNTPTGVANASGFHSVGYMPYKAFDGLYSTDHSNSWTMVGATGWLSYEFDTPKTIVRYKIFGRSDSTFNINVKNWTFEGSNDDGKTWTILDKQANITDWASSPIKTFDINNKNPYRIYRVNISANNGNVNTQITELEMFEEVSPSKAPSWSIVSTATPTSTQFIEQGMNSLSPLLDRKVTALEPMTMIDKSEILGVGEIGKVFSETIDLKKYFDIRSMKVEVE